MREPLIPAQIINPVTPVTPSSISIPNGALVTSVESTMKEHGTTIDDSSSFVRTPMKDDAANHRDTALHHSKENNATVFTHPKKKMLLCIVLS